jgi:hypothetical protein
MSAHGYTDDTTPAPAPAPAPQGRNPATVKIMKGAAGLVAIAAIAFGASAIVGSTNQPASVSASASQAQATPGTQAAPGGTPAAPSGTQGAPSGTPPAGAMPPGMGAAVTGSTLTKLTAVATAKVPGTVERAMKLADGSYVVHVMKRDGSGEVHVLVSSAFKVTGTQTGGPGGPPGAAGQAAPPASSSSPGSTQS